MDYRRLQTLAMLGDFTERAVGIRLAAAMRAAGLTHKEMARLGGKSASAIGNAVRGANYPDISVLVALYQVHQIDLLFSLYGETKQLSPEMQIRLLVALEDVYRERDKRGGLG